jgi:hypothetical protein
MSLILSEQVIQRFSLFRPVASPGVAVVGRTRDNRYETIQHHGTFSPYVLAYEVDVADHHDIHDSLTLPSRGDVFEFNLRLIYDWRVTDPVTVVARQVADGPPLCTAHLVDVMRDVTRQFPIDASADAEAEIRRVVGTGPIVLAEGITIYRVRPQLSIDASTRNAGHARASAMHDGTIAVIKSRNAVAEAHHQANIQDIHQQAELRRRHEAMDAVQSALSGNYDPIALHLAQHPDQTGQLVEMIRTDFRESQQRRDALIRDLAKQGLIQDIDVGDLASSLLNNASAAYQAGPQRTFNNPRVVQGAVTNSYTQASAIGTQSSTPETPADQTAQQPTDAADNSGVIGWRRLPPHSTE